jgi:hypothetical protein
MQKRRMPRDVNQRAKLIVDMVYGEAEPEPEKPAKNPAAVQLGRLGGSKGGKARAARSVGSASGRFETYRPGSN